MGIIRVLAALLLVTNFAFGAETLQVTPNPDGQRAFADLGAFYADNKKQPDYAQALKDLAGTDAAKRSAAGAYLLALFKQSFADEGNGRAPVKRSPFFGGGGANSDARTFRQALAQAFAKEARNAEALDAVLWLLEEEKVAGNQAAGLEALKQITAPQAADLLKKLLAQPHPVASVLKGAIELAAERGHKQLALEIGKLCGHYRTAIREAARAAAAKVGLANPPEYKAEAAFTPLLEKELERIAALPAAEVIKDAKWSRFTLQGKDGPREFSGWLLATGKDGIHALDWFGTRLVLSGVGVKTAPRAFTDDVKELLAIRADGSKLETLSRRGGLTFQFEPKMVTLPEALVGAWSFKAGDKSSAAALLFPRLETMADDRWLAWMARDLCGPQLLQEMLDAFSHERDYARVIVLAKHLAGPAYDEYAWQKRAATLAAQLEKREADFKTFVLPKPADWETIKKGMKREDQAVYLAERLRLLNCIQMGQPGDVNYADPQTGGPHALGKGSEAVINPFNELRALSLQPGELAALVPFLADENFMPTYSYWRDFHPKRTLHQVNWAVASILDEATKKRLSDLGTYANLDEAGRKQHLEKIAAWCKAQAGKTRDQLPDELPKRPAGGPRIDAP